MSTYFRITGYLPEQNATFIADSNGKFEKMWQFSAYLVSKGCKILAVSDDTKFLPCGIEPIPFNADHFVLRTCAKGTATETSYTDGGVVYNAIRVKNMLYVPDRNNKRGTG